MLHLIFLGINYLSGKEKIIIDLFGSHPPGQGSIDSKSQTKTKDNYKTIRKFIV
jgi:hypothetical protein